MAVLEVKTLDQQQNIDFEKANDFEFFELIIHSGRVGAVHWQQ